MIRPWLHKLPGFVPARSYRSELRQNARLAVAAVLLVFGISCSPPESERNLTVITSATVINGMGQSPIADGVVIIEDARILAVGPGGEVAAPNAAKVIDARGKFVIPGIADMHNHLGDGTFGPAAGPEDWVKNLAHLLPFGVTMVFSPEMHDLAGFVRLKQLAESDTAPYPHFFGVGNWLTAKGGLDWQKGYSPETPEQARTAIRELKASGVDAVKFVYSDNTYAFKKPYPMFSQEVMAAIVDEAHEQGLKAYVHAPILEYAKEVLRAGGDGLVHGIISDPIDDEFIALMKENRAVYVATHAVFTAASDIAGWARYEEAFNDQGLVPEELIEAGKDPALVESFEARIDKLVYMKEHLPVLQANTKKAWDAGLLVVAGSDNNHGGTGILLGLSSQIELLLMVEAGLEPMEALQAATINAARMMGLESDLGSVEAGKLADIIILDADPLRDIRNIRRVHRVIKGGVVYDPGEMLRSAG